MKAPALPVAAVGLALVAACAAAFYIWRAGGVSKAGAAVGAATINAAGGVASGAVGALGQAVGLPTPEETVTDPAEARYLIDRIGWLDASRWSGAAALARGMMMASGTGRAPAATSPAGRMLAALAPLALDVQGARNEWASDPDPGFLDPSISDPYYVPSFH